MQCFYHPEKSAVGLCKACSRGICSSCAVDFDEALACRERHEDLVGRLILANRSASIFAVAFRRNRFFAPAFLLLMGLLYAAWGYMDSGINFPFWTGVLLACAGVVIFVIGARAAREIGSLSSREDR